MIMWAIENKKWFRNFVWEISIFFENVGIYFANVALGDSQYKNVRRRMLLVNKDDPNDVWECPKKFFDDGEYESHMWENDS